MFLICNVLGTTAGKSVNYQLLTRQMEYSVDCNNLSPVNSNCCCFFFSPSYWDSTVLNCLSDKNSNLPKLFSSLVTAKNGEMQ